MKKVVIIDDERDARLLIRQYLEPFPGFEIVGECENGVDAIVQVNELEPDVIFLDIQMPVFSGFQVIQQLVHIPHIVFTTAYDQYALKAFEADAIDYLLKPYTKHRFEKTITKLLHNNSSNFTAAVEVARSMSPKEEQLPSTILVENGSRLVPLKIEEVIYIEADKDYTWLHTEDKSYLSNFGIGTMQMRVPAASFLRVHRSYIVNVNHIKEVHRDNTSAHLLTSNNKLLNISRTYMPDLKKLMY